MQIGRDISNLTASKKLASRERQRPESRFAHVPGSPDYGQLQRRPYAPGREFFFANIVDLALRFFAAGHGQDLFKYLSPYNFDRRPAQNSARINIHVVDHVLIHGRVGGDFDRWSRLAAEYRPSSGGKHQDVGASSYNSSHAHGIISRRVHDDEAFGFHRLGITHDLNEGRAASLGNGAKRFLIDGGQPAVLIARR